MTTTLQNATSPVITMVHFVCLDRPLQLASIVGKIHVYTYPKADPKMPDVYKLSIKEDALEVITRDLYKPKTVRDDNIRLLHSVNGMVVRAVKITNVAEQEKRTKDHKFSVETREEVIERRQREMTNQANSSNEEIQYVFIGYVSQPSFYIVSEFGEHGVYMKSYQNSHLQSDNILNAFAKAGDYSVPFPEGIHTKESPSCRNLSESQHCPDCRRRMRACLENIECFYTRERGDYYVIFRVNKELFAVGQHEMFALEDHIDDLSPSHHSNAYTQRALLLMYALTGFNFDRFLQGELTSNHTENTYVLACVKSPLSVFAEKAHQDNSVPASPDRNGRSSSPSQHSHAFQKEHSIAYIEASLSVSFYLNDYNRRTFKCYQHVPLLRGGQHIGEQTIPFSDKRWFRYFVGYSDYVSKKARLRKANERWLMEDKRQRNPEYESLEVHDSFFNTNIVFCTERDFAVEMLTLDGSDVFSVCKRLIAFKRDGFLKTKQYTLNWPTQFKSVLDLANCLFRSSKLMRLLRKETSLDANRQMPSDEVIRSLVRYIYACKPDDDNLVKQTQPGRTPHDDIPIAVIKEKVPKQFAYGECSFIRENNQTGRLNIVPFEGETLSVKCGVTWMRTIDNESYLFKFSATVDERKENNILKRTLHADLSNVSLSIASTKERITSFLYACIKQSKLGEKLDIEQASFDNEFALRCLPDVEPEESLCLHPVNYVFPSKELLEQAILAIEFAHSVEIDDLIKDYTESLDMKTHEFAKSLFSKENVAFSEMTIVTFVQHARAHAKGTTSDFLKHAENAYNVQKAIGYRILQDIEKFTEALARKGEDYPVSTYTDVGLEVDQSSGHLTSMLFDIECVIPKAFELVIDYADIDKVKPIDIFEGELPKLHPIHADDLWLLFHESNLDYYSFCQMKEPLKKSAYVMQLYRKLLEKSSLASFVNTEKQSLNKANSQKPASPKDNTEKMAIPRSRQDDAIFYKADTGKISWETLTCLT